MKFISFILISLAIGSSAFAQQDYQSFGSVTVTPDTVAIHMKNLDPCPAPNGTPSQFPIGMPSAEFTGIRIQNNLDHPLVIQDMTLQTDSDVINVSTEDDIKAMFPSTTIPAHSSMTSTCGLRVGELNVGASTGPTTIHARLDVLGESVDAQGLSQLYENKTNVSLTWDGSYNN